MIAIIVSLQSFTLKMIKLNKRVVDHVKKQTIVLYKSEVRELNSLTTTRVNYGLRKKKQSILKCFFYFCFYFYLLLFKNIKRIIKCLKLDF